MFVKYVTPLETAPVGTISYGSDILHWAEQLFTDCLSDQLFHCA